MMRRTIVTIAFLALSLQACERFIPLQPTLEETAPEGAELTDENNVVVLVQTEQAANRLLINASRRGYELQTKTNLPELGFVMLDFKRPPGVSGAIAIGDMTRMEPSATAGVDHRYKIQSSLSKSAGRTSQPRLYARDMLDWPEDGCSSNMVIGMIDGRVDTSSDILKNANIKVKDFSGGSDEATAHGTAIAEILVGEGGLKDTVLYSASVVSGDDTSPAGAGVTEMILAINWLLANDVDLVNISLAGPYNAILDRVFQKASAAGMNFIAAVGNDGPNAKPRYPAAYDEVIAVTAIDSARVIYDRAVRGKHVDVAAPGVDVFVNVGELGRYLSGTSVAAPFVTAAVASDASFSRESSVSTIRRKVTDSAIDLGDRGHDPVYGAGQLRLNAECRLSPNT
jgi:hypothetical protein